MKQLELFAFEVDETSFYNEKLYYMNMPEAWRNYFNTQRTEKFKLSFKVEPLGKKLTSIFPDIICVRSDNKVLVENQPWLVSTSIISEAYIKQLTLGWLASLKNCTKHDLPTEIKEAEISWTTSKISEIHDSISAYSWIPGLIALKFCEKPRLLKIDSQIEHELKFHHVIFNGKHECISEPIQNIDRYEPFSYVLRVELKTRGGHADKPIITVSVGTRRYLKDKQIKGKTCYMKGAHACSVLVSVQNPYQINDKISFAQLKFKRKVTEDSFTSWDTALDNLYWDVLRGETFKSDELLLDPEGYFEGKGEITAYVVNNNLFRGNNVKAGIGLSEKSNLISLFKESTKELKLDQLSTITDISARGMNDDRFPIIANHNETVKLEIWGSASLFEFVKATLIVSQKSIGRITLLQETDTKNCYKLFSNRDIIVELVHNSTEGIVTELEVDKYGKEKAHEKLVNQIVKQLSDMPKSDSIIALVEIDKKEDWKEDRDPKKAIREGMKKADRITQFIYPLTDNEEGDISRVINCILDLFSDYGYLSKNSLAFNPLGTILTVSILKNDNKYLPVISRLKGTELSIKILGNQSWYSLKEARFQNESIRFLDKPKKGNSSKDVFEAFLFRELENELKYPDENVFVILNAQLRNDWLPQIGNAKIEYNKVPFLNERLLNEPRLKFIRINTTDDVPQYRIIKSDKPDEVNKASGIFRDPLGIYYGVGGRPSAWKGITNDSTKYNSPSKLLLQQKAVEYIPLGMKSEQESDEAAIMIDHLRRLGLTYDKHTIFPYTMRVLNSLMKYLVDSDSDFEYDAEFDEEVVLEEESMV